VTEAAESARRAPSPGSSRSSSWHEARSASPDAARAASARPPLRSGPPRATHAPVGLDGSTSAVPVLADRCCGCCQSVQARTSTHGPLGTAKPGGMGGDALPRSEGATLKVTRAVQACKRNDAARVLRDLDNRSRRSVRARRCASTPTEERARRRRRSNVGHSRRCVWLVAPGRNGCTAGGDTITASETRARLHSRPGRAGPDFAHGEQSEPSHTPSPRTPMERTA
jgi:hypothetical protein